MKSKAGWIAGTLATVIGVGLAVAVAGASGAQRGITTTTTTTTTTGEVTVYDVTATSAEDTGETYFVGNPDEQDLTVSGTSAQCCITVSGETFEDQSITCDPQQGTATAVVCDYSSIFKQRPILKLDDGSDRATISSSDANTKVNAGPGSDVVLGGVGVERLGGGPGDDRIVGGGGADRVNGGKDTDRCKAAKEARVTNCESKSIG